MPALLLRADASAEIIRILPQMFACFRTSTKRCGMVCVLVKSTREETMSRISLNVLGLVLVIATQ